MHLELNFIQGFTKQCLKIENLGLEITVLFDVTRNTKEYYNYKSGTH